MPSARAHGGLRATALAPLLALAALAAAPGAALAGALSPGTEIYFLNAQRAANGIPAGITEVPEWSAGCAAHMNYLAVNKTFGHAELAGNPGYTEAGAAAGGLSVLTSGHASFTEAGVNAFERAPIHLMQMLDPFMQRSGAADGCLYTLGDVDRVFETAQTFSYPGDGATAPPSEQTFEGPFVPGAFVGLAKPGDNTRGVITGPSLYFFNAAAGPGGYWSSGGAITAASLTGPDGPVEVRWVDNTTTSATLGDLGGYLAPGGIVIPVQPLRSSATYAASVSFQPSAPGSAPVQRNWTFQTTSGGTATPKATPTIAASTQTVIPTRSGSQTPPPGATAVSQLNVGRRALTMMTNAAGPLWVTVEQPGGVRRKRWVRRQSFGVQASAAGTVQVKLKRTLGHGRHRVTIRAGKLTGAALAQRTVRIR